jgi:hypothetical protein
MSIESIQAIVGTAITDRQFMHDLLNSRRNQAIARFDLTAEEHRVISGIKAETIEQFALKLDDWLVRKEQEQKRLARVPTSWYRYDLSLASS